MSNIIANREVIQDVRSRVLTFLARQENGTWQGTMTDLLQAISARKAPNTFPASASSLSRMVSGMVRTFRKEGYNVRFNRTPDSARQRLVSFIKVQRRAQ